MADFFFFTDPAKLNTQIASQAYGPDSSLPNEKYRVTSMHTGTNAYAYAIVEGDIIIIDNVVDALGNPQPNLINLVLKPKNQPETGIGFIKYYFYKGIKKDSLIDTTTSPNTIKPYSATTVSNNLELLKKINANYQRLIAQPNNTLPAIPELPNFLANEVSGGGTPLYKTFFKDSGSQYQRVKAGDSLGVFDNSGFGIEVIIEAVGFEPVVDNGRKLESIINVPLPASSSQADVFQNNNLREAILNYIDPCAFFGSFYNSKIKFNTTDTSGNSSATSCSGNDVYDKILKGPGSNLVYFNRNTVYLDIRNELDYSIDYFGNYALSGNRYVYASANINNPVGITYYKNLWPILPFLLSDFNAGNPSNTNSRNQLYINLPKGDNYNPIVYVSSGEIPDTSKFFERKNKDKKFIDLFLINPVSLPPADFTSIKEDVQTPLEILIPNFTGNSVTEPICTYVKLKYLRLIESIPVPISSGTVFRTSQSLDNLFQPLDLILPQVVGSSNKSRTQVYHSERFIDSLRNTYRANVSNIGITEDSNQNKILFTYAVNQYNDSKKNNNFFSFGSKIGSSGNSVGIADLIKDLKNIEYTEVELTNEPLDSFGNFPKVKIIASNNRGSLSDFLANNPIDLKQLYLSKDEFDRISLTASNGNFLPDFKIHLGFNLVGSGIQIFNDIYTTEVFRIPYAKYELTLRGYYLNGMGDVELQDLPIPEYNTSMLPISGTKLIKYDILSDVVLYNSAGNQQATIKECAFGNPTLNGTTTELNPKYKKKDRGFKIIQELNTPAAGTTTYSIQSTIYLIQNVITNIAPQNKFSTYVKYFAENIQKIWSSSTNIGLPGHLGTNVNYTDPENPVYTTSGDNIVINTVCGILDPNKITVRDTQGNIITNATIIIDPNPPASKYRTLLDGEIILTVDEEPGGTSFIVLGEKGNRIGRMVYDNVKQPEHTNPYPYFSNIDNIPAHEFGHILGLADRYLFVVGLRQGDDYLNDSFTASGNPATTMTMALHGEYDPEYILKYRWRHNLMATQTGVFPDGYIGANKVNPLPPPPRIFVNNDAYFFESPEPPSTGGHSYKVLYTTSRPTENVPGLLPPDYSIVAVFITEQQFNLIINNNSTAGGSSEFKNKTLFSSGVNKRKNFPKKYVFILKHNTGTTLDNFTGLRLDWMGINVSLSGTEALQTDYNSDGYPTNELPWKVDTLNASDSYLHPPGTTSFPSINYKSSLFERKNISILNNGWLPEDTKLIQQLGDLSTSQKVFNVCIGGKREPYISSIDGQTRTEGEELILIHNLMLQLAAIDLTLNPMTPARTQPLTDTVTQLAAQGLTPIQIRQIRNVLRLFDGDSDTRTLNKAKRQTSTTGYGVDGFSDLGADNNIVGETSGESIWNKRGSYFEVDNTRNEQLYQWRLNNTLQANAAATNVIIKRRLGSTPSAPGNPGNFPSDFEVIYKICTSSVTHLLGPNNDFTSIKEVTFKLIYTEYKNREFIINVYGIGN